MKVGIPRGVEDGMRLRVPGEGEAGISGGPPGDLYVVISLRPHPLFVRDGADLHCEVPISFVQAALGSEIDVPTLDGRVKLRITSRRRSRFLKSMSAGNSWASCDGTAESIGPSTRS